MQNIRAKIKRKLSLHDKNPNLDEHQEPEDIDEETTGHLHREIEKAEEEGHPQGKPGSFLNKLIMHGNKKTEEQMAREAAANQGSKTT
ncbi:hypothetical protein M409DRAFT_26939 [Zasmidium cellare ATCC 36951]|uniref:Uncharacterized protein n=1 Tax=Zasmidium cellare ATCC 36951 TaxID=1080233 RepID=A0A6A6C789_ZASCE|nr:uncharacterized protein M409DRAFT_26939 [Zasmidium cellare ATCC 36951]KAF2162703.1 hypothetical protein M409DRAFT_26939 [Zasmidium cellare ATCC 36951]